MIFQNVYFADQNICCCFCFLFLILRTSILRILNIYVLFIIVNRVWKRASVLDTCSYRLFTYLMIVYLSTNVLCVCIYYIVNCKMWINSTFKIGLLCITILCRYKYTMTEHQERITMHQPRPPPNKGQIYGLCIQIIFNDTQ